MTKPQDDHYNPPYRTYEYGEDEWIDSVTGVDTWMELRFYPCGKDRKSEASEDKNIHSGAD